MTFFNSEYFELIDNKLYQKDKVIPTTITHLCFRDLKFGNQETLKIPNHIEHLEFIDTDINICKFNLPNQLRELNLSFNKPYDKLSNIVFPKTFRYLYAFGIKDFTNLTFPDRFERLITCIHWIKNIYNCKGLDYKIYTDDWGTDDIGIFATNMNKLTTDLVKQNNDLIEENKKLRKMLRFSHKCYGEYYS